MNIKFNSIKISNFLSVGQIEINLNDQGFVLVEGINKNPDDNAKSNGAGKSSIAESIMFALTGETIRGTKDVVRRGCVEGCCVELSFSVGEHSYIIIRYKEHIKFGNQIKFFKDDVDVSGKGIRDTEDIINGELPDLTKELVGGVIILGQGLPQRFTNNTPVERKAILERLSKSDFMIEDIKQRLSFRKSELQTALRFSEDSILGNERELRLKNNDLITISKELEGLTGLDELTQRYQVLNKQVKDLLVQTSNKRNDISELDIDIIKLTEDITTLTELTTKQKDAEVNVVKDTLKPLWAKKSVGESRIDQLTRDIKKAKEIKDICPTCGQKLQGVICIDTKAMEEELKELKESLIIISEQELKTNQDIKAIELMYLNKNDIKMLKQQCNEKKDFKVKLEQEWRDINNTYQLRQRELNTVEVELNSYESKIKDLSAKKNKTEIDIETLELDINKDRQEKDMLGTRLDIIQKLSTTAQREFRTYLLESIIVYIDERVKNYSKQLFNTEADFKQDGNFIYIGFDNKQYEALSGGEKQKIDISVQFALRDMLVDILGFNSNILFIDEFFDNLDSLGTESIINLITKELGSIESVFIITHHSDTMVPNDKRITLVKDETGITKLIGD